MSTFHEPSVNCDYYFVPLHLFSCLSLQSCSLLIFVPRETKQSIYILKRSFQRVLKTRWQRVHKRIKRKGQVLLRSPKFDWEVSQRMSLSGKELRHQASPVTLTQQRVNTTEHFKGKGKGGNRFHKRFSHPLSFHRYRSIFFWKSVYLSWRCFRR